ncbi:MAG TPA: hypothetical protein VM534_05835, partial [Thermoanaerobaculia bacterium]|nr:hypothetical protein [Thermoanaerobaculia bacterium]
IIRAGCIFSTAATTHAPEMENMNAPNHSEFDDLQRLVEELAEEIDFERMRREADEVTRRRLEARLHQQRHQQIRQQMQALYAVLAIT